MKKILIIYLFQIIALALTGQNIPVPGTAFIGVNIIDPGTKKIIKDQTVYIEQSFIKQVAQQCHSRGGSRQIPDARSG